MTFELPAALALLVALPLAWWLHRRRRGAEVVRVASLLAFAGAAEATPSAAPRRAFDWRLALVLTAMSLLAFAAAGPQFGATRPPAFVVVLDASPSTTARTCDAASRADALLRAAAPDATRDDVALHVAGAADGLPGSLAPHFDAARRSGFPGVVLVTDAKVETAPGLVVIGPSAGARSNVAVASASLDGDDAVVALRNHGPKDVAVKLRCADATRDVVAPAGGVGTARFVAPDRGEEATFEIASPEDDFEADDRLVVARRGGARRVRLDDSGVPCPRLESALRACGVEIQRSGPSGGDVVVTYRSSGLPSSWLGTAPWLNFAPGTLRLKGAPPQQSAPWGVVRGDAIVGRGAFADVLPAPGTTLVCGPSLVGGEPLWTTTDGAAAQTGRDLVVVAVDPEDPRSDWHRDPSFPAFVAAALDHLAGGSDRLEPVHAVPASESDVVHEPPRTSSPEEIRAVLRPGGAAPEAVRPARWLALAAGALLAASVFVRGR
jgi:hypothetical protein